MTSQGYYYVLGEKPIIISLESFNNDLCTFSHYLKTIL